MPSDQQITRAIQSIIRDTVANGEEISVNDARTRAEEHLGLDQGFLKSDAWKAKSKDIIRAAFDSDSEDSSETKQKRSRDAVDSGPPKKRVRTSSADARAPQDKSRKSAKRQIADQDRVIDSSDDGELSAGPAKSNATTTVSDDDSDMSSLIDEPPARKRQPKSKDTSQLTKQKKSNGTSTKTLSPDEELVKTLQSQLVKCGVRKLWHNELKQYSRDKDKIRHLKGMLEAVGMTGRFSAAKAAEIKEARELAAELESAQQFDKSFGTEGVSAKRTSRAGRVRRSVPPDIDESDEDGASPVKAGVATGLVDFGDSGDDGSD